MNTQVMFSSEDMTWATPQSFFDSVNEEFKFNTDVCATKSNAKCKHFFSPKEDGLTQKWEGTCWMNPPYGRELKNWIEKAYLESKLGTTVVALVPARTDTRWFHDYIYGQHEIRFIKGRLKFSNSKTSAPFPSMLVIFKPEVNN